MKDNITISCIIAAWNEEKNIAKVLDVITTYSDFDEIIVIDDGSRDKTSNIIQKYDKVKLIQHKTNLGKTAAVLTGIKESKGKLIVLIDADLINLTHENINKMIIKVINKEYDMTILDRQGDRNAIWGWTNGARFFGGERTFWRKDFNEIEIPENSGYLLEIILNLNYMNKNKKIKTIYCKNLDTVHQYEKIGKVQGYYNYLKMSKKIVEMATIRGYIRQINYIEDEHSEIASQRRKELKEKIVNNVKEYIPDKTTLVAIKKKIKTKINK